MNDRPMKSANIELLRMLADCRDSDLRSEAEGELKERKDRAKGEFYAAIRKLKQILNAAELHDFVRGEAEIFEVDASDEFKLE